MEDVARAELFAVLRVRLAGLPNCTTEGQTTPAADPEEVLRKLMVALFPKLMETGTDALVLNEASSLLCSIESQAERDIRFLDAFNRYYEITKNSSICRKTPGWCDALACYRRVVARVLVNLERGILPSIAEPLLTGLTGHEECLTLLGGVTPRRILVLADNFLVAARILLPLTRVPGMEVSVLVCNNHHASTSRFVVRQVVSLAQAIQMTGLSFLRSLVKMNWKVSALSLDSQPILSWIGKGMFDVGLHGMGLIYRHPLLKLFRLGVLNAHIGYLPTFRGRSVLEWSLLSGRPAGITVFFIDDGIDTGERIVMWKEVTRPYPLSVDEFKRSLFDMDGRMYELALREMCRSDCAIRRNDLDQGRRYFVMSELLKSVVTKILSSQLISA